MDLLKGSMTLFLLYHFQRTHFKRIHFLTKILTWKLSQPIPSIESRALSPNLFACGVLLYICRDYQNLPIVSRSYICWINVTAPSSRNQDNVLLVFSKFSFHIRKVPKNSSGNTLLQFSGIFKEYSFLWKKRKKVWLSGGNSIFFRTGKNSF